MDFRRMKNSILSSPLLGTGVDTYAMMVESGNSLILSSSMYQASTPLISTSFFQH
jgi:hypothetical protein